MSTHNFFPTSGRRPAASPYFNTFLFNPNFVGQHIDAGRVEVVRKNTKVNPVTIARLKAELALIPEGTSQLAFAEQFVADLERRARLQGDDVVGNFATFSVDIITFSQKTYQDVPVLFPAMSPNGAGLYSVPRVGSVCVIGFASATQPYVLGFFNPITENGDYRADALPLKGGESAMVADGTNVPASAYFAARLGGVMQMRASSDCYLEMTPAGDTARMASRNFNHTWSAGSRRIFEATLRRKNLVSFQEIHSLEGFTEQDPTSPFVDIKKGHIRSDFIVRDYQTRLIEQMSDPRAAPIYQGNVNQQATWAFAPDGSIYLDVGSIGLRHGPVTGAPEIDILSENPLDSETFSNDPVIDIRTDGTVDLDAAKKITFKSDEEVEIVVDDQVSIVITSDQIEMGDDDTKVTMSISSGEIEVEANTVKLSAGDIQLGNSPEEGVAKGQTLLTYLSTIASTFNSHTHAVAPGITATPGSTFADPPDTIESENVKTI